MPNATQSQQTYAEFLRLAREKVQADLDKGLISASAKQLLFNRYLGSQLNPKNPYWAPVSSQVSRSDILAVCQYRCSEEDGAQALSDFLHGQIWKDDQSEELLTSVLPTELSEMQVIRESLARFVATNPLDAMSYFQFIIHQAKKNPYQKPNVALKIFLDTPAYRKILGISLDVEPVLFHILLRAREYKLTPEEIQNYVRKSYTVADKLSKEMEKFPNRLRQHYFGKLLLWILSWVILIQKSPSKLVLESTREFTLKRSWNIEVKENGRILRKSESALELDKDKNKDLIDPAPTIGNQSYQEIAQVLRETSFPQASTNHLITPIIVTETLTTAQDQAHPIDLSPPINTVVQNVIEPVAVAPIPGSTLPLEPAVITQNANLVIEPPQHEQDPIPLLLVARDELEALENELLEEAAPPVAPSNNGLYQIARDLSGMIAEFFREAPVDLAPPGSNMPDAESALPPAAPRVRAPVLDSAPLLPQLRSPIQQMRIDANAVAHQQLSVHSPELLSPSQLTISPILGPYNGAFFSPGSEGTSRVLSQSVIDKTAAFTGDRRRPTRSPALGNVSRARKELFSAKDPVNPLAQKDEKEPPVQGNRFCTFM